MIFGKEEFVCMWMGGKGGRGGIINFVVLNTYILDRQAGRQTNRQIDR